MKHLKLFIQILFYIISLPIIILGVICIITSMILCLEWKKIPEILFLMFLDLPNTIYQNCFIDEKSKADIYEDMI